MLAQAHSDFSFWFLLPEMILLLAGCVVLLVAQSSREGLRRSVPWWTLGAIVLAILVVRWPLFSGVDPTFATATGAGLWFGTLADFVRKGALVLGVVLTLVAWAQPATGERGEFFSMMLFSLTGLMLVGSATDLVVLFLALELVSIPTYVMVTLSRTGPRALEAGTKYFYLGAMSAAVTAYGFSFIYGAAGSASLSAAFDSVARALSHPGTAEYTYATIGVVLSLGGLLFKIAAVPLHFYIADVYQGAGSPVAAFLGFVPKLAGLAAIFRIIDLAEWQTHAGGLFWFLWIIAALSMTVGNVLALRQTNIKRMLGYSGIAHSGYMLVGVLAGPMYGRGILGDGTAAVLYYVVIYGLANLTAFAVLGVLRYRDRACETLQDVAGLLRRHPVPALLMALAMFTLMGLPPTPGFWGKMSLFGSALTAAQQAPPDSRSWIIGLVILAVLNSALAAAYYLRVIAAVLLYESDQATETIPREAPHMGAVLGGFLILFFAFYPSVLLRAGRQATGDLRGGLTFQTPDAVQSDARGPCADNDAAAGVPPARRRSETPFWAYGPREAGGYTASAPD